MANLVIGDLLSEVAHLDGRIKQYDAHVRSMARQSTAAQQLMQLMGVGETTATTVVAMVGNASEFDCGRQFAAWLGLTPGQYSSGGKPRLERITKAGDPYLRGLLVMGARAVLNAARTKSDSLSLWAVKVAGAAACAAQGLEAGAQLRLPAPHRAGAVRLLQVLHLRPTRPLGEAAAMPTRPAWRCACSQPMAVLRRRMPAEVPSDSPSDPPVVHDKPDKAGPMDAHTMH